MKKCQKCQKEIEDSNGRVPIGNDPYYVCQGKGQQGHYYCQPCFKNNEAQYINQYNYIKKEARMFPNSESSFWGGQTIKETKPIVNGEESNFFECQKCHSVRNYETAGASEFENGCPNCQSKDFELKVSLWNGILHYKIKECSKCHKMDMADLIKWPDTDELKGKIKSEIIKTLKQEKLNDGDSCQCSHNENNNDREKEREREQKCV